MRRSELLAALLATFALAGCSTGKAPKPAATPIESSSASPARAAPMIVSMAPIPDPEPSAPPKARPIPEKGDPEARVQSANAAARVQPSRADYENAVQVYPYTEGALFQVYTAPGHVTDLTLEPGERLTGSGPVAAGDTARWIIGDTESGSGATRRVHILVKPTRPSLQTNLVINTDRRTYHIELRSTAATYMASVSWRYPQAELLASAGASQPAAAEPRPEPTEASRLYRIEGSSPAWRPVRAWDDGRQTFIEFPDSVTRDELPPLFVVGRLRRSELVNYRVRGRHMVVDRLFKVAELRLGEGSSQTRVRIIRR